MADECEDISNHQQMGGGIWYINKYGINKEQLLALVQVPNTKSKTLQYNGKVLQRLWSKHGQSLWSRIWWCFQHVWSHW
jgi:hypothetical protein